MHNLPVIYTIDIANRCNLKCAFCLEGIRCNEQPDGMMTLDDFKKISESFLSQAKEINLQNWSEPFLNKAIFDIVKYINDNSNAKVIISTNGNIFTAEIAKKLLDLKIYRLMISMSGLENKIYQIYHKGGDINKVYKTIIYITNERLKRRKDTLREFQVKYLLFDYNFITYGKFKDTLINKFGQKNFSKIDKLDIITGYLTGTTLPFDEQRKIYSEDISRFIRKRPFKDNCHQQLETTAVRCDGKIFFCCAIPYRDEYVMGDLSSSSMAEIWNSQRYRKWREDYLAGKNDICNNCFIYNVGLRYLKGRHIFEKAQNRIRNYVSALKQ